MSDLGTGALLLSLLAVGLAGSLHCASMCGPLLVAFSKWTQGGGSGSSGGWWLYHGGRLWTYSLLGFTAGWLGLELRGLTALAQWHRPMALALGGAILAAGLAAFGWLPGLRVDLDLSSCLARAARGRPWLAALARDPRAPARLLLGAIMGLLPCAMVYGAVLLAATLPHPLLSAAGMLAFGIGTLPSTTAVLLGVRLAPRWLRAHGPRLTASVWIAIGFIILWRAITLDPGEGHLLH